MGPRVTPRRPPAGDAGGDVVCLSVTEAGRRLAGRLPYRRRHGDVAAALREEWARAGGLVVVLATGATVRLIAPLLADKGTDPCVVCVDDAGRYAVVVSGGHRGGGNALAREVAGLLGAEAVVTTATDLLGVPALDDLPGFTATGDVAGVTAALLDGRPPTLVDELGWPLPGPLARLAGAGGLGAGAGVGRLGAEDGVGRLGGPRVVVTDRTQPATAVGAGSPGGRGAGGGGPGAGTVLLHPRSLVVGVGTVRDAAAGDVFDAVAAVLGDAGLAAASVERMATIDRRADHPAVVQAAASMGVPIAAYAPADLDAVDVPSPGEAVRDAVGTRSVAEAAALLAAGPGASLLVEKRRVRAMVTVAVARRARPAGRVTVVGLGPGAPEHRTPAATRAVRTADTVVGFSGYVDRCRDLLTPGHEVLAFPLGAEVERARAALARAGAGRVVALVCSGDAGVYGMASPLLELPESAGVEIDVVPGVTAGSASAALLGAPLGHDHVVVSLSDLHTPWERIEERLRAAAGADLVVVIYNPRSARRTWQLGAARDILLEHRGPDTPVGVVTDAGRAGQRVDHTTLADLPVEEVTMTTCVIVGSRTTRRVGGRMVTPRGYFG